MTHREKIKAIVSNEFSRIVRDRPAFVSNGDVDRITDSIMTTLEQEPFSPVFPNPETHLQESIEKGHRNADPYWLECYKKSLRAVAEKYEHFTSDKLHEHMKLHYPDADTHDWRAAGSLFTEAKNDQWLEKTDQKLESTRKTLHYPANQLTVWHSLIYKA